MVFKIHYLTVEPYVFLYFASSSLSGIILPQLLLDNICQRSFKMNICLNINSPLFKQEQDIIQKETALWLTVLLSTQSALCILANFILGPLADTIGIRNTMFLTPMFLSVYYIIGIILTSLGYAFHPGLFLLAIPFIAFCGFNEGTTALAHSYIATVTSADHRTFRMYFVSAAFTLSGSIFSFLSGFLLNWLGYAGVYAVCLAFCVLNALYLTFFVSNVKPTSNSEMAAHAQQGLHDTAASRHKHLLQDHDKNPGIEAESIELIEDSNKRNIRHVSHDEAKTIEVQSGELLSIKTKIKTIFTKSNPITNFKGLYNHLREHNQRQAVFLFIICAFTAIGLVGEYSIFVLFVKSRPLYFDAVDIGYIFSFKALNCAITGYIIINYILQRCLACSDYFIITISLSAHAAYLIILGFSTSKLMIYLIQLLYALAILGAPTIRSSLTKLVDPNKYATVLAVSAALQSLATFVANLCATIIYAEFISIHRGGAFFFLALFLLLSVMLSGSLMWKEKIGHKDVQSDKEVENTIKETAITEA